MAQLAFRLDPQTAAEKAVSVIGLGYDLYYDLRLGSCKSGPFGSKLIELDHLSKRDLLVTGGVVVSGVPSAIKCDKGERTRFRSDVLSFTRMSEHFNQELSLSGKIPSGMFNTMFDFKGRWQKDLASTKTLAFDGCIITLYNIELDRSQIMLSEQIIREVPTSWDPSALAEFIEKYGTHIIVGVKMGGKDVIHIKQLQKSNLQPAEVQKILKQLADERFLEDPHTNYTNGPAEVSEQLKDEQSISMEFRKSIAASVRLPTVSHSKIDETVKIFVRRGGIDIGQSHSQWLSTISQSPNVISMSLVPITSLVNGIRGNGFLSHAVNLYLRYKPPIEELAQFLEFQLPRQWAPTYADLPLSRHRKQASPSLKFSLMGPKVYVNTMKVDTNNRPVTGIRLFLEGNKGDHLAIHLQHLSSLPKTLQLTDDYRHNPIDEPHDRRYFEPVKWSMFSHICTFPVQYNGSRYDDSASIVTKAWFEVKGVGIKKVLFLRLGFSTVHSAIDRRSEWEGSSNTSRKSGLISALISTKFSNALDPPEKPLAKPELNSAVFPGGPPMPTRPPRMLNFIDTKELVRGPEDLPGYWVVTGAKLCVEGGMVSVKVKYSLITIISEDSMT